MLLLIFFFSWNFRFHSAYDHVATENEILGDPLINCTENGIHFQVNTRRPFNGRIFAHGKVDDANCVKIFSESSTGSYDNGDQVSSTKPFMDLGFETCGMDAVVSTEPHGIYFSVKLTVSFHRLLITKNDKFFKAKCFFAETRTSVNQHLEVRNNDPIEYLTSHHTSPCNYAMYNATYGSFENHRDLGPPLTYAQVGDRILHVWSCPDHFYGIMVYDCYVSDGYSQNLTVVDDRGCSADYELVSNIKYGRGLHEAYAESQVFKFAEKPVVYFHCRIEECDVNKTESCPSFMQPHCDYSHHSSAKLAPTDAAPPAFGPPESGSYINGASATGGLGQQSSRSDTFAESTLATTDSSISVEESARRNLKRLGKFSSTLLDIPLDDFASDHDSTKLNGRLSWIRNKVSQQQKATKSPVFQNVKGHLIVLDHLEELKQPFAKKHESDDSGVEENRINLNEEQSLSPEQCLVSTVEAMIAILISCAFFVIVACSVFLYLGKRICITRKKHISSPSIPTINFRREAKRDDLFRD